MTISTEIPWGASPGLSAHSVNAQTRSAASHEPVRTIATWVIAAEAFPKLLSNAFVLQMERSEPNV